MHSISRGLLPLALMTILAGTAHGAAMTFRLDQSNALADSIDYLQVTIVDGANGAIDFTVDSLPALLARAGDKFEIRAFAFNFDCDLHLTAANIVGLPENFQARHTTRMDGFGRFDMGLFASGPEHTTSLAFSIAGIEGDTPLSYVDLATGKAGQGNAAFAARVRGLFQETDCRNPERKCTPHAIPSAFVGGGTEAVPLPGAAWLMGAGVAAALTRVRRRRAA